MVSLSPNQDSIDITRSAIDGPYPFSGLLLCRIQRRLAITHMLVGRHLATLTKSQPLQLKKNNLLMLPAAGSEINSESRYNVVNGRQSKSTLTIVSNFLDRRTHGCVSTQVVYPSFNLELLLYFVIPDLIGDPDAGFPFSIIKLITGMTGAMVRY